MVAGNSNDSESLGLLCHNLVAHRAIARCAPLVGQCYLDHRAAFYSAVWSLAKPGRTAVKRRPWCTGARHVARNWRFVAFTSTWRLASKNFASDPGMTKDITDDPHHFMSTHADRPSATAHRGYIERYPRVAYLVTRSSSGDINCEL